MSKRTRGTFLGLTCRCAYSYPQQSLKKDVVNWPSLVPAWCKTKFLSSSAQAWTCTSSVKMLVLVKEAILSGDSITILQLRGDTITFVTTNIEHEALTWGVNDVDHVVMSVVELCSRSFGTFPDRSMSRQGNSHEHEATASNGPRYGNLRCTSLSDDDIAIGCLKKSWMNSIEVSGHLFNLFLCVPQIQ